MKPNLLQKPTLKISPEFDPENELSIPRISIITAAFNAEKTIRATVESIRLQTLRNWEYIVVDDGSTDNTLKILRQLEREEYRLHAIHQKNARQAAARNAGIRLARGEFIAIIDADDQALPERLEKQVSYLDQHKEIDVLGAWAVDVEPISGHLQGIQRRRETHDDLRMHIYKESPFITSTVIARRWFFIEMKGFRTNLTPVEDYDLWLRGYRYGKFHNLQEPLVYYARRQRMRWKSAIYSARVILEAALREKKLLSHFWYALRPLAYAAISKLSLMKDGK